MRCIDCWREKEGPPYRVCLDRKAGSVMGTWNDQERGHEAVRAETPSRRVAGCMAALVGGIGLGGLVGWEAGVPWLMHWAWWWGWEAPGGALAMLA